MAIKQTDIRLMEINSKLNRINDRFKEMVGEKNTILFKLEHGEINPMLAAMKICVLDFEASLIEDEIIELKEEYNTITLIANIGLDFMPEEF